MTTREEIDQLRAELDALKARTPTPVDHAAAARFKDEMHQLAERRASAHNAFSRADLAEMERACPADTMRSIVADNRAGTTPRSQAVTPASATPGPMTPPGGGSGWAHEAPLANPPGTRWVDRQLDAQDQRDLHDRIVEEARLQAMMKAPEAE